MSSPADFHDFPPPPTHLGEAAIVAQRPLRASHHLGLSYAMLEGYRQVQLDLYVPRDRSAPVPLVIFIHGGAFLSGGRAEPPLYWPVGATFQLAIDAGLAIASIDYRHAREAPFPAQLHDGKAAVRYLRHYAADFGIDPDRIGVWGESAGGQLASLIGVVDDPALEGDEGVQDVSSRVSAVVAFYPVTDNSTMPDWWESMPAALRPRLAPGEELPPSPRQLLMSGSPLGDRAEWLSAPVHHAAPDSPPFLLVHGDADGLVPIGQSEQFEAALRAAGAEVELVRVAGADHVFLGVDPLPQLERAVHWLADRLGAA